MQEAYERYLDATVAAMESGDPEHPALAATSAEHGLVAARARVVSLTSQGHIARGELVPQIETLDVEDATATIRDCYRVDLVEYDADTGEQVADRDGVRFSVSAILTHEGDRWKVVEFVEGDFCVPAEFAAEAEARYLDYWDAVYAASEPADPDHPALAEAAAGQQLDTLRQRLREFRERGHVARRGGTRSNPRAVQVFAADTVVMVRDCRELDPDEGVYDAETGERVTPPAEPGERSLWEARLELIDGSWRTTDTDLIEEGSECDPASF
ncbi:MAG TPA: hypothetical protein VGA36_10620 [Nitriliruptorales bacterium]